VVDQLISAPTASDVSRCGQGDITLTATANSNGILQWFDAPSGQLLDTGMSFTNNLTQTTNFWVNEQKYVQLNGGKLDQSGTGANYTLSTSHGQIFSVTEALTLKSVKVYANGQANRTISLTNQSNQIIYSQSFNIPNGESRVELNWDIPVGTDYTLKAGAAPNLYRNGSSTSAQLPYPYQIGNVLQITGNTASNSRYYYFFYDWEIEYASCVSPLTQVTASVNPNPTANFSFSDLGSFSYQFTNLSTDYTSLLWHFGDGQTSTEVNPLHNYANAGYHTVSLDATNDCGTITSTQNITAASIENHALQMVKAYPNPTNDYLYIEHRSGYNSIICNIFDIRGQLIHEQILNSNTTKIATDQWASGIYTIRLVSGYDTQWLRVVK
jgi:PKD repeat protein